MGRTTPTSIPTPGPYILALRLRGFLLMGICILGLLLLPVRLWWIQSHYPEQFESIQCFQNARTGTIPASRGRILDADGRPLADNRTVYTLFVNPSRVNEEHREQLADVLISRLQIDAETVTDALWDKESKRGFLIEEMKRGEIELFENLSKADPFAEVLCEVGILRREARVYPMGPLAGPLVGFTASRDEGQVGLWGLEAQFDEVLSGRCGLYEDLRDQRGQRIPGSRNELEHPRDGSDLVLTIDADIQALAEAALTRGIERTGSIGGSVIITRPSTGNILALVSQPALDPSHFEDYLEDEAALFSRSTCLSYEPGSVMKIFTIASALEEQVIEPDAVRHVGNGPLRFRGGLVPDHHYGPADLSLRDIIVHSSNRGAALIALDLGRDRLTSRLKTFGFGERTNLEIPGEPSGDLKEWLNPFPEIDLANMGFGHGIAISPLQLVQAMSVFANDGVLVPLRLIDARCDPPWGWEVEMPVSAPRKILSERTVSIMEEFMRGVVEEGTATQAGTEWPCAGKTGTAQKINPEGGYYDDRFFSTFIGYGPLPNAEWMILVILDEPGYPHFGGTACGPVFREIFNALMLREGQSIREAHVVDETSLETSRELPAISEAHNAEPASEYIFSLDGIDREGSDG